MGFLLIDKKYHKNLSVFRRSGKKANDSLILNISSDLDSRKSYARYLSVSTSQYVSHKESGRKQGHRIDDRKSINIVINDRKSINIVVAVHHIIKRVT